MVVATAVVVVVVMVVMLVVVVRRTAIDMCNIKYVPTFEAFASVVVRDLLSVVIRVALDLELHFPTIAIF